VPINIGVLRTFKPGQMGKRCSAFYFWLITCNFWSGTRFNIAHTQRVPATGSEYTPRVPELTLTFSLERMWVVDLWSMTRIRLRCPHKIRFYESSWKYFPRRMREDNLKTTTTRGWLVMAAKIWWSLEMWRCGWRGMARRQATENVQNK